MSLEFSLNQHAPASAAVDCIVVGAFADGALTPAANALDAASGGRLKALVERGDVDNVIVTMSTSGKAEVADEQEAEISMPGVTIRRVPFVPLPEVDVEPEPLPPRPVPTQAPAPVVESGEVEIPF